MPRGLNRVSIDFLNDSHVLAPDRDVATVATMPDEALKAFQCLLPAPFLPEAVKDPSKGLVLSRANAKDLVKCVNRQSAVLPIPCDGGKNYPGLPVVRLVLKREPKDLLRPPRLTSPPHVQSPSADGSHASNAQAQRRAAWMRRSEGTLSFRPHPSALLEATPRVRCSLLLGDSRKFLPMAPRRIRTDLYADFELGVTFGEPSSHSVKCVRLSKIEYVVFDTRLEHGTDEHNLPRRVECPDFVVLNSL
jgi:hypothetical protein